MDDISSLEKIQYEFISEQRDKKIKKCVRNQKRSMIAILALFIISIMVVFFSSSSFFGFYNISSGSMQPTLSAGDVIYIKSDSAEKINIGDIITYDSPDYPVTITHRVISKDWDGEKWVLHTQGDNNIVEDGIDISDDIIVGKTVAVFPQAKENVISLLKVLKISLSCLGLMCFVIIIVLEIKKAAVKKKYGQQISMLGIAENNE